MQGHCPHRVSGQAGIAPKMCFFDQEASLRVTKVPAQAIDVS